jgi:hypothetical protein
MLHFTYEDGREYEVPADLGYSLSNQMIGKLNTEASDRFDRMRREENHPTLLDTNLVSSGLREMVVRKEDATRALREEGVPCLRWVRKWDGDPGWQLSMTGVSESLGFAAWDDPDGIRHIIDQIDDQASLATIVALTSPEKALELTSRQIFNGLRREKAIPPMTTSIVMKMLTMGGLGRSRESDDRTKIGMRPLKIQSGKIRTAVAIEVISPIKPFSTPRLEFKSSESGDERAKRENLINATFRRKWDNSFSTLAQEEGWRFVDVGYASSSNPYSKWITLIPAELWEDLIPAIREARGLMTAALRHF